MPNTTTTSEVRIDITPTWGEWGNTYRTFAESREVKAIRHLREDFARAMAAAQALKNITALLTDEQATVVAKTMADELTKQGF